MIYTNLTKKALILSFEKHKDQFDKSGIPYVYHPFIVACEMKTEEQVCIALLHDIIEDTDITEEDLYNYGFPEKIVEAIKIMTYNKNESYFDYIIRIKSNNLATTVKIEDLKHNSDMTRLDNFTPEDLDRISKYKKALELLQK